MEITAWTKIEELVNVETVSGYVEKEKKQVEKWLNSRIDALDIEMMVGGLSPEALMLDNESPLFDKAKEVKTGFENIIQKFSDLKSEVKSKTRQQRLRELDTLEGLVEAQLNAATNSKETWETCAAQARKNGGHTIVKSEYGYGGASYSTSQCETMANSYAKTANTWQEKLDHINQEQSKLGEE